MNYKQRFETLHSNFNREKERMETLIAEYESAIEITCDLLERCEKEKITKVAIGMKHESVPVTITWPFGYEGSVFTFSPTKNNGFPPIWGICDALGISKGCGNTDQRQVKYNSLVDGVYHFHDGWWVKVDEQG